MVALTGSATRPAGSDSAWPPVGTVVPWRLAQPIADLALQAEEYRHPILGIIGEKATHLTKHGDHTPWSADKKRGVIYAIDLSMPNDFEAWLVKTCKSSYDTTWIDFFNIGGRQYNNAGVKTGTSSDYHLHLSVAKGFEDARVTLLADYHQPAPATPAPPAQEDGMGTRGDDVFRLLHDGKRPGLESNQTSGGGVPVAWIVREIKNLHDELAEIKSLLVKP